MLDMADMETGLWSDDPRIDTRCLLGIKLTMTKQNMMRVTPSKKIPN